MKLTESALRNPPAVAAVLALVLLFGGIALWLFVRRHEARLTQEAEQAIYLAKLADLDRHAPVARE